MNRNYTPETLENMDKAELNARLRCAATFGYEDECRAMLAQGAEVDAEYSYGGTALLNAIRKGHLRMCSILLDHGASLSAKKRGQLSPLQLAVYHGQTAIVDYLVETHGESLDQLTPKGETLDQLAQRVSQPEMAHHLMARRSQLSVESVNTALDESSLGNTRGRMQATPKELVAPAARKTSSLAL